MGEAAACIEVIDQFSDPRWRLNNLYWCVDERGKEIPFRVNTPQERLLEDIWYWNLILKARQMGFTTFIDILGLDQAVFNDTYSVGICAHTREDVEKIFEKKVKFPYDRLPEQLKTARRADTESAKKLKFNNGSSVEVGTSLRSGTYQFVHVSEFGKICAKFPDKAKEIVTGTFETVHPGSYLFVESTSEGRGGYFHDYVMEANSRQLSGLSPNKLQFRLHFFPWYEDAKNKIESSGPIPAKITKYLDGLEKDIGKKFSDQQRAWYATKSAALQEDMGREHPSTINEAFDRSIEGAYLAKQMATLRAGGRIGVVPHEPERPVDTAWDFGISDRMCIWFHQLAGLQHRLIGYMSGTDDDVLYYWREMQKHPYLWGKHYLPHDAGTRRLGTATSAFGPPRTVQKILEDAGMTNIVVVPLVADKYTAIQESRLFLPKCWIDSVACDEGIKCLDEFRREWDERAADWKNRPLHNWAMHGYDAFETLARGLSLGKAKETGAARPIVPRSAAGWGA